MIAKDDHRRRLVSTARTALAGAVLGSIGGAITGALSLLGDEVWTASQCGFRRSVQHPGTPADHRPRAPGAHRGAT